MDFIVSEKQKEQDQYEAGTCVQRNIGLSEEIASFDAA
jgi:hypothetical protein